MSSGGEAKTIKPFSVGNATYIPDQIDPDGKRRSSFVSGTVSLQHLLSASTTYRIAYQAVDTRRGYEDGPQGPYPFDPPSLTTSTKLPWLGNIRMELELSACVSHWRHWAL